MPAKCYSPPVTHYNLLILTVVVRRQIEFNKAPKNHVTQCHEEYLCPVKQQAR